MQPSQVLLALSLAAPISSAAADDWSGPDKVKHFAISAVLGTLSAMHYEDRWQAFGVALIPGVLKEVYDGSQPGNHFSGKDMAANALGAAIGVQVGRWIVTRDGIGYQAAF